MSQGAYLSLLLADGRLPTGAHTQSAGLEPALHHGLALADVPAYVSARLDTVTATEAAAAVVARHRWLAAADPAALAEVDRAWRVRTASGALRAASDQLGRSYLRLAATVWPALTALRTHQRVWARPVVVGATAAVAGLDPAQTARLVAVDDVQTVVAAALKLQPFDPTVAVAWTVAAGPQVEALVERVAGVTDPPDIPSDTAPQIEHWAELHTRTERRLFRA